jgi:hypothetical protein
MISASSKTSTSWDEDEVILAQQDHVLAEDAVSMHGRDVEMTEDDHCLADDDVSLLCGCDRD